MADTHKVEVPPAQIERVAKIAQALRSLPGSEHLSMGEVLQLALRRGLADLERDALLPTH